MGLLSNLGRVSPALLLGLLATGGGAAMVRWTAHDDLVLQLDAWLLVVIGAGMLLMVPLLWQEGSLGRAQFAPIGPDGRAMVGSPRTARLAAALAHELQGSPFVIDTTEHCVRVSLVPPPGGNRPAVLLRERPLPNLVSWMDGVRSDDGNGHERTVISQQKGVAIHVDDYGVIRRPDGTDERLAAAVNRVLEQQGLRTLWSAGPLIGLWTGGMTLLGIIVLFPLAWFTGAFG